ncbi:hypothetical protein ACHAXA_010827 [Cyclostephanos tholiformis]|uniref:Uncharacterized protein n=1 Tax=Cyclostephanos tholiformis TaxID=382380 RepID=A0ABD3SG33_9STRA
MKQSMKDFLPIFSGFMAFSAFIITLFGASYCNFVTFCQTSPIVDEPAILHYGIWWYRGWVAVSDSNGSYIVESCLAYDGDTVIDSNWKAARAFNTLALIFGIVVGSWATCVGCTNPSKKMFQATGALYMLVCFFTGMSLLLLQSNACKANESVAVFEESFPLILTFQDTCSLGAGAKTTIAATVLWFVAAVASCMSEPNNEDGGDVVSSDRIAPADKEVSADEKVEEDLAPAGEEVPEKV